MAARIASVCPASTTHDPVLLAVEGAVASLVEYLEVEGAVDAAALLAKRAHDPGFLDAIRAGALRDALEGGRLVRQHRAVALLHAATPRKGA